MCHLKRCCRSGTSHPSPLLTRRQSGAIEHLCSGYMPACSGVVCEVFANVTPHAVQILIKHGCLAAGYTIFLSTAAAAANNYHTFFRSSARIRNQVKPWSSTYTLFRVPTLATHYPSHFTPSTRYAVPRWFCRSRLDRWCRCPPSTGRRKVS